MSDPESKELLELTQRLLDSITTADWDTYFNLCDPSLTAFEPESIGQLVEGMEFHRFYFDLGGLHNRHNTTLCSPHVRIIGDVAIVCYVRLIQYDGEEGPVTVGFDETRIWQKRNGQWKHIHFHRSRIPRE